MSGRSDSKDSSSSSTKKKPIRLLRFLQPALKPGKASLPQHQPRPTLSGQYSDRLFTDEAVTVVNDSESQTTNVGNVLIEELRQGEIPTFDDDLADDVTDAPSK